MSDDIYELLASAVVVIREDPKLLECFNRVLEVGAITQQVRVSKLQEELTRLQAPDELLTFVRLLGNDQLAHQVFVAINN